VKGKGGCPAHRQPLGAGDPSLRLKNACAQDDARFRPESLPTNWDLIVTTASRHDPPVIRKALWAGHSTGSAPQSAMTQLPPQFSTRLFVIFVMSDPSAFIVKMLALPSESPSKAIFFPSGE